MLAEAGPPLGIPLPATHGRAGDPRYPSKHDLRDRVGFTIDVAIHLGAAIAVAVALAKTDAEVPAILVAMIATYVGLSIVHRVFLQWAWHTTVGKAVAGLRLIRDDTGGPPTLGSLVKQWLFGVLATLASAI